MIASIYTEINSIVNLDHWEMVAESATGTREKSIFIDPTTRRLAMIKFPQADLNHQIWFEIFASFIAGDLLGWDVHKARIGSACGRLGSLMEYVFDPSLESPESLIEGHELCQEADPAFEVANHDAHTLNLILEVFDRVISRRHPGISRQDYIAYWARTFALDTLISNQDRHSENWAIVVGGALARMAPLYDNGSCLGGGVGEEALGRVFGDDGEVRKEYLKKFRAKGTHHVRAGLPMGRRNTFEEVCRKFLGLFPEEREHFVRAANIDLRSFRELLDAVVNLRDVPEEYALSARRAKYIMALLAEGKSRLRSALAE